MIMRSNSDNNPDVSDRYSKQFFIIAFSLLILTSSFTYFTFMRIENMRPIITLEASVTVQNVVPDKFLSFGLDSSLLRHMENVPIYKEKFINLARHLSPAYVRIGGTSADCLYFNQTIRKLLKRDNQEVFVNSNETTKFSITSNDFLSLYKFAEEANISMIFDLNVLRRNPDESWNSDNAEEIIKFARTHGMKLDWQLGNEPNSFFHVFNVRINAKELAADYCKLRSLLNKYGYEDSIIVGPEANHIRDESKSGENYVRDFLANAKDCVNEISWHQYYLNGHVAQVPDFINPKTFNELSGQIQAIKEAIEASGQAKNMWISETSSAYGGGAPNISDRFVASFLWLDKLGYSAKLNVQVLIRQTLYGGYYAMVSHDLDPNPDWWVSVLFKKLVSGKVLDIQTPNNSGKLRVYAHCAAEQMSASNTSSIVIYGLNLNADQSNIYLRVPTTEKQIFAYILTSNDLQSRDIYLNEKLLKLKTDGSLPHFQPEILSIDHVISLPPYSLVFFVIHQVTVPFC